MVSVDNLTEFHSDPKIHTSQQDQMTRGMRANKGLSEQCNSAIEYARQTQNVLLSISIFLIQEPQTIAGFGLRITTFQMDQIKPIAGLKKTCQLLKNGQVMMNCLISILRKRRPRKIRLESQNQQRV